MNLLLDSTPTSSTPLALVIAFGAGFIAGGINSVAGGGSMISFPILIGLGLPPLIANATNTAGIWSGAVGSVWGFREELSRVPNRIKMLLVPALIGGLGGAILLRFTSLETFNRVVPFLLLFATLLFIVSGPIQARLRARKATNSNADQDSRRWIVVAVTLQLLVAVYGGYFGAGMSIMMLSVLALIGMTDMLEMTAMTSLLSIAINGISGLYFILNGLVYWPFVVVMAVGAVAGGYGAAGVARKVGKVWIRRLVISVGLLLACYLMWKMYG